MSNMYHTESALGRNQRQFENATWEDILRRFANLQTQIKILAGGEEIDVLLQRIEDTITNAQSDVTAAIDANNTATQDAITANNQALQTALNTIAGALTDLDNAIKAADTATADTIAAKEAAIQATEDALTAINQMQGLINNLKSRGPWNSATAFKTNNLAEANGKTYIALQDHTNKPVTDTAYWALFADKGVKGDKGEKGDTGAALSILGKLTDPSQLPPTGTAGDAYTVNGELWVWSENTNAWENVGNIKGEKGDKGEEGDSAYEVAITNGFVGTEAEWLASLKGQKGDKGDPGADADLTQIEQTVSALDTKVTTHLDEKASNTVLGHIKTSNHFDLDHNGIPKNNKFNANTLVLQNVAPKSDLANLPDSCRYYAFIDGVGFVEGLKEVSGGYVYSWQQKTDIVTKSVYRRFALSTTQWSNWRHVSFYDVVTSDYTTGQIIGNSVPLIDGNAYLLSIRISRHANSSDVFLYTVNVQGTSLAVIPIGNESSEISIVIDENNIIYVTNTSGNNLVLHLGVMPLT